MKTKKHFGDYTDAELMKMNPKDLIKIIKSFQMEDNFITMTDSYKQTHHLLLPDDLKEVYSYMEPRGGEMPYTVSVLLQYYAKRYLVGCRITPEKIEEARDMNIKHFGFDCFNDELWQYIVKVHGGKLPLEIKAVPEGTPVAVKNIIMSMRNTDPRCAALTNPTETLLMKLWASNTVATYARVVRTLILKYHLLSSDAPQYLVNFMHHDFGYRGVSSEESARILGAAGLSSGFLGTDTLGAIKLCRDYYNEDMAGFSVIASEHSVTCCWGSRLAEPEAYLQMIEKVKKKCMNANPPSKVIIVSLVSDTYNIYNVCYRILPHLQSHFIGWTNNFGCTIKIVVRPDSGTPTDVLFGYRFEGAEFFDLSNKLSEDINKLYPDNQITKETARELVRKGVFGILFDAFGFSINSKGFKVLHPQIGVLQGDGISLPVIQELFDRMISLKYDTMNLVVGSGGKYLQSHERDDQKYAIKCTHIIRNLSGQAVEKNPITDSGKKSKIGYLKLVKTGPTWRDYRTASSLLDADFDQLKDELVPIFLNGELVKEYDFTDIRKNSDIEPWEYTVDKKELELV